jgi:hypothetical protein
MGGACQKEEYLCPTPVDPNAQQTCKDDNTCCYFSCNKLTLDDDTQIGQADNCGGSCTFGIMPDINGVVHPELFLMPNGFYTDGEWYNYDQEGPMNIQGTDKNMFNRCKDQCWGEASTTQFLLRIEDEDGRLVKKSCDWLATRENWEKRTVCTANRYNLSTQGYESASLACPETCAEASKMLVEQFYCRVLQRPVESDQALLGWIGYLQSNTVKDLVRVGILSDEFRGRFVNEKSAESQAGTLYDVLLARPADTGGLVAWTNQVELIGWESAVDAFLASDEYNGKFGDAIVPGGGRTPCAVPTI